MAEKKVLDIATITQDEFETLAGDRTKRELLASAFEAHRVNKEKEIAELTVRLEETKLKVEQQRDPEKDRSLVREHLRAEKYKTIYETVKAFCMSPHGYVTLGVCFVSVCVVLGFLVSTENFWQYLTYISEERK